MITFVPVGGLANRMRGIEAAIFLAQDLQTNLHIIWYKDWGLNCRFDQLFQPFNIPGVTLKEATFSDLILYDRPRKRNLFVPYLFQKIRFQSRIYEDKVTQLYFDKFDFKQWAKDRNVYLASYNYFYGDSKRNSYQHFKPLSLLINKIEETSSCFNNNTIGIHIRRTDHLEAISTSPTELFVERIEEEISKNKDTLFYLATDSEKDKELLLSKFGNRIITSAEKAERNSVQGIQQALLELYLLSKTKHIIGSFNSSFSEAAAQIGGIDFEPIIVMNK